MFAALPMYDRPQNRSAHDALWQLIRDGLRQRGLEAPDALNRDLSHMEGWQRADLVLSQICNLPYRALFRGQVTLIGAADYGVAGIAPGYYRSVFIVRADDPVQSLTKAFDRPFAFNEALSNSGWGMPQQFALTAGLSLKPVMQTGSHLASLGAVAEGKAGLAAIDEITLRNLLRWEPLAQQVRVIGHTYASPGMTFVTRAGEDPSPYRSAIAEAIEALSPPVADILGLEGIVTLSLDAYDLPLPPRPETAGYAEVD